jgi:multicomponent K+:H+ antiporter subunit D
VPRVLLIEIAPIAFLLALTLALSVLGGPVMRYMDATAHALHAPAAYVQEVLSAAPRPNQAEKAR